MRSQSLPIFQYWKNPYHLFVKVLLASGKHHSQAAIADALRARLIAKGLKPHMDRTGMSNLLRLHDYLDLADEAWRESHKLHFPVMNEMLRESIGEVDTHGVIGISDTSEMDLFDQDDRANIEKIVGYRCPPPDNEQHQPSDEQATVRGIWQLFHPSALEAHTKSRKGTIRTAALVIFGFLPTRSDFNEKSWIKALLIGRSGVWRAKVWNRGQRLLITAEALETLEDQFFVFDIPNFQDNPYARKNLTNLRGMVAGSVFDEAYRSRADVDHRYPLMTAPCVARRLPSKSRWFETHDVLIDTEFAYRLKEDMPCDYFEVEELLKLGRSAKMKRNTEYFEGLRELLNHIRDPRTRQVVKPYLR